MFSGRNQPLLRNYGHVTGGKPLGQPGTSRPDILFEDFEHGMNGWSQGANQSGLWHLANPGSCGASSHAMAYSKPATCNYDTNGPNLEPTSGLSLARGWGPLSPGPRGKDAPTLHGA